MRDLLTALDFPVARNIMPEFFNSPWFITNGFTTAIPAANIIDNDKEYKIDLAAPGLKEEDFDIIVKDHNLLIKAEKEEEKKEKKENFVKTEYNYNSFSRTFYLDEPVDEDKISATYKTGILELVIPKKETKISKDGKHIPVNSKKMALHN